MLVTVSVLCFCDATQSLVRTYHELRQQVVQCDVALWGLEARAEWWPGSAAGAARQLRASCLLGCIEVLMEGEAVRGEYEYECKRLQQGLAAGGTQMHDTWPHNPASAVGTAHVVQLLGQEAGASPRVSGWLLR